MKPIKRKTYYNFMRVVRMIEAKGYDHSTAVSLAHQKFEQFDSNPSGLSILSLVDMIIPASEYYSNH